MTGTLRALAATADDCAAIARIYNQGIDARIATFETRHRTPQDIEAWLSTRYPVLVVTRDAEVVGFAATSAYRPRECYAGIAEYSVYVANEAQGVGSWALRARVVDCGGGSSRILEARLPHFSGKHRQSCACPQGRFPRGWNLQKHAQLDGVWKDVVIVERLLNPVTDA